MKRMNKTHKKEKKTIALRSSIKSFFPLNEPQMGMRTNK